MKKFLAFGAAMLLGLGAFAGVSKYKMADATDLSNEEVAEMKAMMGKYINSIGQYTKKSRIYIASNVQGYDAQIFHASHDAQERTTYYTSTALLMGDLDGSFAHINSGYANDGNGNMDHFISQDGLGGLVAPANRTVDYTVHGKEMKDYFFNLNDLINSIQASDWGKSEGGFYHDIEDLALDANNDYNDPVLKKFQYFAAPMLLQNGAFHYLSPKSIVVNESHGSLHICIYASNSDIGKLNSGSNLLAETRVYAGLQTPGYYLVGSFGSDYDWQIAGGREFGAGTGTNLAELLDSTVPAGQYKVCTLNNDGSSTWYGPNGSSDANNLVIKVGGTFNFFVSGNEGTYGHIYKERTSSETVAVTFNINYGTSNGASIYLTGPFADWKADADYKLSNSGSDWTGTFNFPVDVTLVYKFIVVNADGTTIDRWESDPNRETFIDEAMTLNCSWKE